MALECSYHLRAWHSTLAVALTQVGLVGVGGAEAGSQQAAGTVPRAENDGSLGSGEQRAIGRLHGGTHGVGVGAHGEHGADFAEGQGTDEHQLVAHRRVSASARGILAFAPSLEDELGGLCSGAAAPDDGGECLVILAAELRGKEDDHAASGGDFLVGEGAVVGPQPEEERHDGGGHTEAQSEEAGKAGNVASHTGDAHGVPGNGDARQRPTWHCGIPVRHHSARGVA